MLIQEIKNFKCSISELRTFGIAVGIILGLLGGLTWWSGKSYYNYFLIASLLFLLPGIGLPILLKPIYQLWMTIALLIGWIITRSILIILFYFLVTPIGLLAKLFGKHFLWLGPSGDNIDSYWIPRGTVKYDKKKYERQF